MKLLTRTVPSVALLSTALLGQTIYVPSGTSGVGSSQNSNVGIGTNSPGTTLDVVGQARANYVWAGRTGANNDGRIYVTDSSGNVRAYLEGYPGLPSYINNGNFGIGTTTPLTLLQVAGPITAGASGGSTSGVDYLYGYYSSGKTFVLGSQYSSAASFLAYGLKAQPGATGYLSSTNITIGRSAFEANMGFLAFLTGGIQTSTDGGSVNVAERMRIDQSGKVGIGTSSPAANLDIGGLEDSGTLRTVFARQGEGNTTGSGTFLGVRAWSTQFYYGGKMFSIENTFYGNLNSSIEFYRGNTSTGGFLTFTTNNGTERVRIDPFGNVGIGTTHPTQKLSVAGTVRAQEVIVDTGWSDYVFDEGYQLSALSEVEQHIKAEKHLPGIPSAKEVAEQGISLGEMQAKLLAKIEELTLHQIEQEKRIAAQDSRIHELESKLSP